MTLQDQLKELQHLDARVRGMSRRQNAATRRGQAQREHLDLLKRQHEELHTQLQAARAATHNLEQHIAEMDQRIETLRDRMNNVTSNKEYSALLLEVNTLKTDKAKVEDEALEQMNQVELLQARMKEAEEKIAGQQKLVEGADRDLADAQAEVGEKLAQARAEREEAAKPIPPEVLSQFDRLSEQFDGEAVCEIEEQDRRRMEYTCGGCYMTVPVERVNALITRPDELITCPNCNRILTIPAELKDAIGAK